MRILLYSLFFLCTCPAMATDAYVTTDDRGRKHFSDIPPDTPHEHIRIEIRNDYNWQGPETFTYTPPEPQRRKRIRKVRHYSLDELKNKCHAARGRYNNFRGTNRNIDWDTYRARLAKYKAKRDKWCSRLAKGK
ncbi:MAG: DUF4124 domain-containing protein [Granulosicoccaceae bacterium]|jgi:hypothetical protein